MRTSSSLDKPIYEQVRQLVREVPAGKVSTYGQIASYLDQCTARMVGHTMAGLPEGSDVPWHRIINASGRISPRGNFDSSVRQRKLLESEGIIFRTNGSVDLRQFGWSGPSWQWLAAHGIDPENSLDL